MVVSALLLYNFRNFVADFLKNILQRRGDDDAWVDRKGKAVGLSGPMIGILPENDDFGLVERGSVEGRKNFGGAGIDALGGIGIFGTDKLGKTREIWLAELVSQCFFPSWLNSDIDRLLQGGIVGRIIPLMLVP